MRYLIFALTAIVATSAARPSLADNLNNRARRIQRKAARLAADYPGVAVPSVLVNPPPDNYVVGPPSIPVYPRRWTGFYGGSQVPSGMIGFAEPGPVPYGGLTDYSAPIDYNTHSYGTARGYQGTLWPAPPAEAQWTTEPANSMPANSMPVDAMGQPIEIEQMPAPAPSNSLRPVPQQPTPANQPPRPADDELLPDTANFGPRL